MAEAIERGRAQFIDHGLQAEFCLVGLDGSDDVVAVVTAAVGARSWECVVVGGGIRGDLALFERVVNLVRQYSPDAAISFNSSPEDTFDAAARWLDDRG